MSVVRIAAAAAVFSLLSAVGATAKPVTLTAETNLRKAAGTDSEVLALMPKGSTVEVGKCTNGWCEAAMDDKKGFAIAQNLGMARRPPPRGPDGEEIVEEGPPVYGPRYVAGPPGYYRPYYGYGWGYGPYYGYGWGYRGWGWRW